MYQSPKKEGKDLVVLFVVLARAEITRQCATPPPQRQATGEL